MATSTIAKMLCVDYTQATSVAAGASGVEKYSTTIESLIQSSLRADKFEKVKWKPEMRLMRSRVKEIVVFVSLNNKWSHVVVELMFAELVVVMFILLEEFVVRRRSIDGSKNDSS